MTLLEAYRKADESAQELFRTVKNSGAPNVHALQIAQKGFWHYFRELTNYEKR